MVSQNIVRRLQESAMSTDSTNDAAIDALANFPTSSPAAWVAKVQAAATPVIAGALIRWTSHMGVTGGPDGNAFKREAAQAVLQARLSDHSIAATNALRATIEPYQQESSKLSGQIKWLTWLIAVLAAVQLYVTLAHL